MRSDPVDTFLQEADDLLGEIEGAALSLTADPNGGEPVNRMFRAFHTIKGSGAMFGFDAVAAFTHHVETLLDQVREGVVPVSAELTNMVLAAADQIRLLLLAARGCDPVDGIAQEALLEKLRRFSMKASENLIAGEELPVPRDEGERNEAHPKAWNICFRPDPSLLARGGNPLLLFRDLKRLGECVIDGHTDGLPALGEMQTDVCYLWWTIRLTGSASADAIRDVFLFVQDGSELRIEPAEAFTTVANLRTSATHQDLPAGGGGSEEDPGMRMAQLQSREATVRVPASRLDRLVNLVGELVMNQSRLMTAAAQFHAPELAAPVEEIERLVAELRDDVLQIRMMPIGTIFGRFRRLVHDLSSQLDKEIELITEGEETELDKSILDALAEPLVHLLRNSIDHGIEPAEERRAKGKPLKGTIRLTAIHRGSDVVVCLEDDGAGLNRGAIRAKAVARQIIAPDAHLSDKEIFNLILQPGFSTAQTVTSVSGRGVGMDVVKRHIDTLRGTLSVSSEAGRGTSVSLTLPLTLAIIDGLLVEAGESQYIIPMAVVTENVELPQKDRDRNNGRNLIAVRGELVPYIDLRESFQIEGAAPVVSKIVLVRYQDQRIGLVVDRVLGTHQTVIQSLGLFLRNVNVISGATIMGDGRVALILDISAVVRHAERQSNTAVEKIRNKPEELEQL